MKTRYAADERGVWRRADFGGINYSDGGEVEERLLRIISGARRVDTFAPELNCAITDWPSEYHLSRARHCLLRPLDIRPGDRVLELGCGCGALTRYLGETGAEVVAVDGNLARASIAVSRCRDLPNVKVFCDDLIDFETDARFDWVILVGVLEYAPLFSKSPLPVEHYINSAGRFLAPEGQLVVAIENQLGLKYFNGCAEDHVGLPFFGVEHLYGPRSPVTYGRQELARRMQSCGFSALDWFYPFPDYKLPTVVVSSRAYEVPRFGVTDLLTRAQSRDYTGNRMRLFDEALACSALERNGLIEDLSNSFLLLARRGTASPRPSSSIAWTFAVHRREEFITQTAFIPDGQHIRVEKARLSSPCQTGDKSGEHARLRHSLKSAAYTPGRLSVWRILEAHARSAPPEELVDAFLPWFDELLRQAVPTSVSEAGAISKPARLIDYEVDGGMIDLTPFNLIEHDAGVSVIDQEWEWSGKLPLGQVVCRSVLHSLSLPLARGQPYDLADIVKRLCARRQLSVECEDVTAWLASELEFLTAVGAPVPSESSFDVGRGHLIAVYPELVKRIGEASALSAKITCVLAEHAAQRAQIESQIAENAAAKAELEARLSECVDEISALHQVRGSQAAMISALTRDLSDQAAAIEAASRRDESQALAGELNTARALLEYTHRELEAAQQSATTLAEAHRQLLTSTSWRITAPLRVARTEARQIGGRVRSGIRRFLKNAPGNAAHRQLLRVARTEARRIGGRVRSGIRRFGKSALGNAVHRQFRDKGSMNISGEAIVELTLAGRAIKFTGDPNDAYFRSLATFHAMAPQLENYLSTHLRPDAVCLDIGANIGLTAILLALYSPEGRTFAFEASPKNARYLRRNLELNGITTCVVIEAAVGDRPGTVSFRETEFCAGSHVAPSALHGPSVISVPMVTIDGFAEERALRAEGIDFIKMDVEGFEPAVLAGAARTLEQNRCPIFMEFNSWCLLTLQNFNPLAFASAVFDRFHVHRIDEQGAIVPSGDGSVGGFLHNNLVRNGCVDDILLQLQTGKSIPALDEMTRYGQDLQNARELHKLRAEINASRSSEPSNTLLRTAVGAFGPRQETKHP